MAFRPTFEPLLSIIDQIANGSPPTPRVTMRYELLRFCQLRNYPKENKPYLVRLAEAGFYHTTNGDGVECYCCGVSRYNWSAEDNPTKIHERINPNCQFLKKNEEVNVPVQYFGPYSKSLTAIMDIPEPRESLGTVQSGDVPSHQSRPTEIGADCLELFLAGRTLTAQEEGRSCVSDAVQFVLEMGFQPRIIQKATELLRVNGTTNITARVLLETALKIEEEENGLPIPDISSASG